MSLEIRDPDEVSKRRLVTIVQALQELLYLDAGEGEAPVWVRDKEVNCSDFVDNVNQILVFHDLAPHSVKEWKPRRPR